MKPVHFIAAAAFMGGVSLVSASAQADDGRAVAGIAGFVGGMLVGNAIAQPHYYVAPPPPYAVVYDDPPPARYCHFERGRPYWDEYEGVWRHTRVRVCD